MSVTPSQLQALLPRVHEVARDAGDIAMRFFRSGAATTARIWAKTGGSPVTEADVAVDTFLKIRLSALVPQAAWLSEETADEPRRLGRDLVWIVDPIDGTRAFLAGSHDWSIAIALLSDGIPVLGIVHVPAHDCLYDGVAGAGARKDGVPIAVSSVQDISTAGVAGPAPFVDRLARGREGVRRLPRIPSLALRIVRVAEGAVDLGLISSDARDWDIAAADVVLREAGGELFDFRGDPPLYNQPDPVHGELAATPARLKASLIAAIKSG